MAFSTPATGRGLPGNQSAAHSTQAANLLGTDAEAKSENRVSFLPYFPLSASAVNSSHPDRFGLTIIVAIPFLLYRLRDSFRVQWMFVLVMLKRHAAIPP